VPAIPLDSGRWDWRGSEPVPVTHLGRDCFRVDCPLANVTDLEPANGTLELELAVGPERSFPGVVWRLADDEDYESFFVRPHQVGNPDAIQYTPVFNDVSAWQLYHGEGYWAPIAFPIDAWFTIRVLFEGTRAEVFVADELALQVRELKLPAGPGRIGIATGGATIHVASFACSSVAPLGPAPPPLTGPDGIVPAWDVSDPFPENDVDLAASRSWTRLQAETSGLANLARVHGIRDGRNTVLARAVIRSDDARTSRMEFGFSDRAVVFLNGRPLYRGTDGYRSRDYRFLGSIGWWDSLHLDLEHGDNDLAIAVSEDFGGWGVQARFPDATGLTLG
jgi:hypothetical protein